VNPAINAVVDHRPEEVLAEAAKVDAILARRGDPGPMAGVPVTIKVNVDQAGFATTNGLRIQNDHRATADNPVVANLRKAGAVLLGRTNTPAFSLRWFCRKQPARAHEEPVEPGHHARRLLGRRGGGDGGGHRRDRPRH
jgi:amidase